ncbi:hypothetical protein [Streptobacillus moniliformis]|uniref:hypothetical protein n=1 Tax=Streptobacillus moniliformis TaxID=34105 RepID=UPI0007E447E7|nr:hypothetical protein [Streptobacillus moniliformis]
MKRLLLFLSTLVSLISLSESDTLKEFNNLNKDIHDYIFGEKLAEVKKMIESSTYKSYNDLEDSKIEEFINRFKKLEQNGLVRDDKNYENLRKVKTLALLKNRSFRNYQLIRFKTYSNYKLEPTFEDNVYFKIGSNIGASREDIQGLNVTVGGNYSIRDNAKIGGFIHYDNKLGDLFLKTHAHIFAIGANAKFKLKNNKGDIESFIAYKYNYGKYKNIINRESEVIDNNLYKGVQRIYDEYVHQHSFELYNKYSKKFNIIKNLKIYPQIENYTSITPSITYSNIYTEDNLLDTISERIPENEDDSTLYDRIITSNEINHIFKNTLSSGVLIEYGLIKNLNIYLNSKLGFSYENVGITSKLKIEKYRKREMSSESAVHDKPIIIDIDENEIITELNIDDEIFRDLGIELNGNNKFIKDKIENSKWKDYINNIGISYDFKIGLNYKVDKFNIDTYLRFDGNTNNNEKLYKDSHKISLNTKIGYNW